MHDIVKAVKALSCEIRLRTLNLLLERECSVYEVMRVLDISQTRASRNLHILYDAGFLKLRRQGLWALYSIGQDMLKDYHVELLESVRQGLKDSQIARDDIKELSAQTLTERCARI